MYTYSTCELLVPRVLGYKQLSVSINVPQKSTKIASTAYRTSMDQLVAMRVAILSKQHHRYL